MSEVNSINSREDDGTINLDADAAFQALVDGGTDARSGSRLPIHLQERLEEAEAVLDSCHVYFQALTLLEAGTSYQAAVGGRIPLGAAKAKVQQAWMNSARGNDPRFIGRVTITREFEVEEVGEEVEMVWDSTIGENVPVRGTGKRLRASAKDPMDPQLVFVCLSPTSPWFVEGEREAAAISYTPCTTYVNSTTGELAPSYFDERGYSHISAWFGSYEEAVDVRQALIDAVAQIRMTAIELKAGDEEFDPIRSVVFRDAARRPDRSRIEAF